ncbi:DUF420 domain-containing protein [Gimesia panareensis]|uniref:Uncharacterized protein n=1 Tax=Gimesia panareensis TaxID=2527978 RepID=A0A517Q208_9PLAN|nr:DUF420 domain-containing protein [Gimesia panareensis]QDT25661.1 hypothetical protein Enr10x_09580 [Gimesia panareensis]QDU48606.1 hypothetical protein Pan110_09210 [Gimesia panareensis]
MTQTEPKPPRRIPLILTISLWILVAVSAFATWQLKKQSDLALEQSKAEHAARLEAEQKAFEAEQKKTEETEEVSIKGPVWPKEGIEDFSLTERSGKTITKKDLLGKPWVACFVFTRCAGPCPRVSGQFYQLQKDLKDLDFRLVTITVDPKHDTPEVLSQYAELMGADPQKWLFLTGDQKDIFHLIEKSFLMPVQENVGPARKPGFEVIHTTNVMLVDPKGRVLGKFNAVDDAQMAELRREVRKLVKGEAKDDKQADTKDKATSKPKAKTDQKTDAPAKDEQKPAAKPPAKAGMISLNTLLLPLLLMQSETESEPAADAEPVDVATETEETVIETEAPAQAPDWVLQLPAINAGLNGLATVLLMVGYGFIRKGEQEKHKKTMLTAFGTSVLFLVFYLVYHFALQSYTGDASRKFQGEGLIRPVYYFILITHVVLAAAVPVLAWITIRRGLKQQWEAHRRIAKITFPIWLYVSITGVVIYLMLYHLPGAS